jgi:endonuclease/exonuclease/phosphatase family metal-dependent hydrolase
VNITAPECLGFLMLSFLFWNLKKLPRADIIARLAREHEVDVLMLAECSIPDDSLLAALKDTTGSVFRKAWSETAKVEVFTRLAENSMTALYDDDLGRLTIRRLVIETMDVLLAAVHFPSKVNWSEDEQRAEMQNLARDIALTEDKAGHRRTILVGDFNMNPFEKGMISSHGLHAVMTRQIAEKKSRKVAGREYRFSIIQCGVCLVTEHQDQQAHITSGRPRQTCSFGTCSIKFWFVLIWFRSFTMT